jgi:hypothetical protein
MGLREQAALDAQAILEDKTSGFAWSFTLTSPQGVAAQLKGFTTDIGQTIDPDTGQAVAGRRASVAISLRSLPELPLLSADENRKPWLVRFSDAKGVRACWKAIEIIPDRAAGIVVLLLEAYHLAPDLVLEEAEGPSLRQQAVQDSQSILEDTFGFGTPITLTSPAGVMTALTGFATDIGMTIDPETGQSVSGRRASVAVPLLALPEIPVVSAGSSKKPWLVRFFDLKGVAAAWKAIEVLPDRALGVVVLLLEAYQQTIVNLTSSVLVLPSLLLSGSFLPVVALNGATLALPALQVAGGLAPVVTLSAAAFTLPNLQLSGALVPDATLAGGLVLPGLELVGAFTPDASLAASALNLPRLQLVGALTPAVAPLSGALVLPSQQISGSLAPTFAALSGSLALPSLQLVGALTPAVTVAGAPVLPAASVAGALTPTVGALSGALVLPSLQVAGSLSPAFAALSGALALPSLQLAGSVTPTVGTLAGTLALPSLQLAGTLTVSASVVGAWLRFAEGTSDANGFSSVPDVLNANPAIQTVNANKPARVLSANGLVLANFVTDDRLWWPLIAANNSTAAFGFMFWIVPANIAAPTERWIDIWYNSGNPPTGGASAPKFSIGKIGATVHAVLRNGAASPTATSGNVLSAGVPACVGFEFNGAGATDAAKLVITLDGVAIASTVTGGAMPTALPAPTGSANIGAYIQGAAHYTGKMGSNLFCFNAAMAGVTSGLLTPAARLAYKNFEAPT